MPARVSQSTMDNRIASDINQLKTLQLHQQKKNINKHFSMVTCSELLVADRLAGPSAQMSHPAVVPLGTNLGPPDVVLLGTKLGPLVATVPLRTKLSGRPVRHKDRRSAD